MDEVKRYSVTFYSDGDFVMRCRYRRFLGALRDYLSLCRKHRKDTGIQISLSYINAAYETSQKKHGI